MVVVSELTSIFWGVALEGGKRKYTQTTERPVHISMAALDPAQPHDDNPVSLMIEQDGKSYILCNLKYGTVLQQPLNLEFASGEELTFYINGKGVVHLSGYVMPEDEYPDYEEDSSDSGSEDEEEEEEEEESDDEEVAKPGKKRFYEPAGKKSKKARMTIDDLELDDDDDDDDFLDNEAEEESDSDEDEDDDDDADDSLVKQASKKEAKQSKKDKKQKDNGKATPAAGQQQKEKPKTEQQKTVPQQSPGADASGEVGKKKKKKKKNKNKHQEESSPVAKPVQPQQSTKVSGKRSLEGGVVVEDVKEGHGPEAKIGKMVRVYYTGRLPNGKIFDSAMSGNGFKFKLGKKEVISGWDVGLNGMKVGGKRKLIIPPRMGYGSQQAGQIPPNSTLIFDVELKSVN